MKWKAAGIGGRQGDVGVEMAIWGGHFLMKGLSRPQGTTKRSSKTMFLANHTSFCVLHRRRVVVFPIYDLIPNRLSYPALHPCAENSVENATPSSEIGVVRYKMRPRRQKLHRRVLAKCTCPPAAFLSNKLYSRSSISTRDWAAAWLGAKLVGRLAGWPTGGTPKGVNNASP